MCGWSVYIQWPVITILQVRWGKDQGELPFWREAGTFVWLGLEIKDGLYAGYCGAIPIPGCLNWYSICVRKIHLYTNTKVLPAMQQTETKK